MESAWSFTVRACPACGKDDAVALIEVRPADVLAANWSFRPSLAGMAAAMPALLPIVRCRACAFVYARLLPNPAFLAWAYDELIDADAVHAANLAHTAMAERLAPLRTLIGLLRPGPAPRVLDVGCGFGPLLRLLAAMPSVRAWGYETSARRLRSLAQDGLRATGEWDEVAAQSPYDAVVLDNVLEHAADPAGLLARVRRICSAGTVMLVSVPDLPAGKLAALAKDYARGSPLPMDVNPWEHLSYFDATLLDTMVRRAGFEPLPASALPGSVDIGLRPTGSRADRARNAAASGLRMARYAASGDVDPTPNARFYRAVAPQ
jgi:SAM-dependent methyltransferase